jgi:hypothetical protein
MVLASGVFGIAHPLQAQRRRRRVRLQLENPEELGGSLRFLDMNLSVDGVLAAGAVNAADRTSVLLADGLREFELTARMEINGRIRPVGGLYRYVVRPDHERLLVRVVARVIHGDTEAEPDPVGCHTMGVSDCSESVDGCRLRVRLE